MAPMRLLVEVREDHAAGVLRATLLCPHGNRLCDVATLALGLAAHPEVRAAWDALLEAAVRRAVEAVGGTVTHFGHATDPNHPGRN
jgi:hypothetical protein